MSGVTLHKQHGLNPTLVNCFICGETAHIALVGSQSKKIFGQEEAPRECIDGSICDRCQGVIDNGGVFFIEVKDGETGKNPYRTGSLWGIRREAAEKIVNDSTLLDKGIVWIEQSTAKQIGFHAIEETQ
jgi:hypothetical protein